MDLNERTKNDFLTYANSVIKSRAVPYAEDNMKPVHRKILYSLWESKAFPDKPAKKSPLLIGPILQYSPHGDTATYEAMARLAQWWKLRYPLIEFDSNCGNIFGDSAAASRYTECRLSKIGMLMVDEVKNKSCVDFKRNFIDTADEPITLPSKFPFILCGNNSGIAVGLASDVVSHNFTETSNAIKYYMDNPDCSIKDLMKFIPGPDFPTGGQILNGEDLLNIYSTGRGSLRMRSHYDISKNGKQTILTFHDLPYGVEIDTHIKLPLKKLVVEEGHEVFESFDVVSKGETSFDIIIKLNKNADINKCLDLLWKKTGLEHTVKVNQNFIVNNKPTVLNLKEMIAFWVNYRSSIYRRIALSDLGKINGKLSINIGLQKCMDNIERVIEIVRFDETPKATLMKEFELKDEQAQAVLDLKLAKLSHLELIGLKTEEEELKKEAEKHKEIIDNEKIRFDMIKADLDSIKKIVGKDNRLTEILYSTGTQPDDKPAVKKEWRIYKDGLHISTDGTDKVENNIVDVVVANSAASICGYNKNGEISPINNSVDNIGGFIKEKEKVVCVTKNGNIKVSLATEYKFTKSNERALKLKEGDELIYCGTADDKDYLMLLNETGNVLKLAIKDMPVASKLTIGVKSGFSTVVAAAIVEDSSTLLFVTTDNKGKLTNVKDFSIDSRGNKGQITAAGTCYMRLFPVERENIYVIGKTGNLATSIPRNKVSLKSRTASGATLTTKIIQNIV